MAITGWLAGRVFSIATRALPTSEELTTDEKSALTAGVDAVRALIDERYLPDAYNVGFNDGAAAG